MNKKYGLILFTAIFLVSAGSLFSQNAQELRAGTSLQANLGAGDNHWYTVRPSANGILTVETKGNVDTYMEAYDSNNNLIREDDDGGEGYNAKITIIAESGSTYRFMVRGYDTRENGPYSIQASLTQPAELRLGYQVRGNINEDETQWYSIRAPADGLMIVQTSGNTDTLLSVIDSSTNEYIAWDDDSGEGYNARVEFFVQSGWNYLIELEAYDSGDYSITAIIEEFPPDTEMNTERSRAAALKLGEAVPVIFRAYNESRWYRYEVTRANVNFIIQTRGSMDTLLFLYDSNGRLISEDDDSGEDFNALISERLNAGVYYIEVRGYGGSAGRCTLHGEIR